MALRSILVFLPIIAFASPTYANKRGQRRPQIKVFNGKNFKEQLAHAQLRKGVAGTSNLAKWSKVEASTTSRNGQSFQSINKQVEYMEKGRLALSQLGRQGSGPQNALKWSFSHVAFKSWMKSQRKKNSARTVRNVNAVLRNVEVNVDASKSFALKFGVEGPADVKSKDIFYSDARILLLETPAFDAVRLYTSRDFIENLNAEEFHVDSSQADGNDSEIHEFTFDLDWDGKRQVIDLGEHLVEIEAPKGN